MDPGTLNLGEDDRFQVEMVAHAVERRNRSTSLFLAALLVLVLCTVFWFFGWRAKTTAISRLRSQQRESATIEAKLLRLDALRSRGSDSNLEGEPINDMGTRLQNIAIRVSLDNLPVPDESRNAAAGGVLKTYRYDDITGKRIEPILEWLAQSEAEVPGLELYSLEISPEEAREQWNVSVTFRRWERAQ